MKEKRIDYLVDNFVDENGDERYFVICAISYEVNNVDAAITDEDCECDYYQHINKIIKLGYSFCRPKYIDKDGNIHEDKFNPELGKQIALGRARKNESIALFAAYEGDINSDVVQALLKRRARYFKNNPGSLIAGYKRTK